MHLAETTVKVGFRGLTVFPLNRSLTIFIFQSSLSILLENKIQLCDKLFIRLSIINTCHIHVNWMEPFSVHTHIGGIYLVCTQPRGPNACIVTPYRLRNQSLANFFGNEDTKTLFGVLSLRKTRCHLMGGNDSSGKLGRWPM